MSSPTRQGRCFGIEEWTKEERPGDILCSFLVTFYSLLTLCSVDYTHTHSHKKSLPYTHLLLLLLLLLLLPPLLCGYGVLCNVFTPFIFRTFRTVPKASSPTTTKNTSKPPHLLRHFPSNFAKTARGRQARRQSWRFHPKGIRCDLKDL